MKYIYIILVFLMTSCSGSHHSVMVNNGPQIKCRDGLKNSNAKKDYDKRKSFHIIPHTRKRNMGIEMINEINEKRIAKGHNKQYREIQRKKKR